MQCFQITELSTDILYQILKLVEKVEQTDFTLKQYAQYLLDYIGSDTLGLFGIFREKELAGYIHAEAPHPLEAEIGFINIAAGISGLPQEMTNELLSFTEQWLKLHGAKLWRMTTTRNPALWERRYGLRTVGKINNESILERDINV